MRDCPRRARFAAIALLAVASPLRATTYERDVLAALNALRVDPRAYADALVRFRVHYQGRLIRYETPPKRIITHEGVAPLDSAVATLRHQVRIVPLTASGLLAEAARDHVRYQSERGVTGHMEGGFRPDDRLRAHGGGGAMTEVIAYGAHDPADVIRQLVIDDGVADRGHRAALLDPVLRFAGVACGPHRSYRTMCVIDMSASWNGGGHLRPDDWQRIRAQAFRIDR